jgi:hypothetical protein
MALRQSNTRQKEGQRNFFTAKSAENSKKDKARLMPRLLLLGVLVPLGDPRASLDG